MGKEDVTKEWMRKQEAGEKRTKINNGKEEEWTGKEGQNERM
jgi:hypothetical protein